jgi:hypothetical protein
MFKFLKNSVPQSAPATAPAPMAAMESTPQHSIAQHTNIKRELIRVVLKDTLRHHAIPYDWLACEIIIIARGPDDDELHIQLVVMKWNELLMRYATAFQQQLLRGLDRFDPSVDHSKYIISWRFAPECGCQFTVMPPPIFWSHTEAATAVEETPSILDRRHARRPADAPLHHHAPPKPDVGRPPETGDGDYERTQLSPFR